MSRFIVRFRGSAPGGEIRTRLHESPEVQVLEETPRMVLVEANEARLRKLLDEQSDVVIVAEQHYEIPDTRPKVRQ